MKQFLEGIEFSYPTYVIKWSMKKDEIFNLLNMNKVKYILKNDYCSFSSSILHPNHVSEIYLHFENDSIKTIKIIKHITSEMATKKSFIEIQYYLELFLGKTKLHIADIISLIDSHPPLKSWNYDDIIIEHYIDDRFVVQDAIQITIK